MQTYDPSLYSQTPIDSNYDPSKRRRKKRTKSDNQDEHLSASELKRKMTEVERNFIRPQSQPELDGRLGVTLADIAKSLGVHHSDLRRKFERSGAISYLTCLNYEVKTFVYTSQNKQIDSYILDVMAAHHIVGSYNNLAGWYYRDFLIRCKDALKVSLDALNKAEYQLIATRKDLGEAKKKIEILTQPRITRRNNIVIKNVLTETGGLFHDTTYRVETEIIKQPKKDEDIYSQHYLQKLARITKGNVNSMYSALKKINCDRKVLNKRMGQLSNISADVDSLINPKDEEKYNDLVNQIESEAD